MALVVAVGSNFSHVAAVHIILYVVDNNLLYSVAILHFPSLIVHFIIDIL